MGLTLGLYMSWETIKVGDTGRYQEHTSYHGPSLQLPELGLCTYFCRFSEIQCTEYRGCCLSYGAGDEFSREGNEEPSVQSAISWTLASVSRVARVCRVGHDAVGGSDIEF